MWRLALIPLLIIPLVAGCAGDDGSDPTSEPTATAAQVTDTPTVGPVRPTPPPRTPGAPYDLEAARALSDAVVLLPEDLDVDVAWKVTTDNPQDNAAFAAAAPELASDIENCGRVFGRTVILQPEDLVGSFILGETLTYFTQLTVYADEAGAIVCGDQTADRLAQPGAIARLFGDVFNNPDAVVVAPVTFPAVGDGSFAATLTGQSDAGGMVIDLTILVVGFRSGNVSGAVGSVRSGTTPPSDELAPYVDAVIQRIEEFR